MRIALLILAGGILTVMVKAEDQKTLAVAETTAANSEEPMSIFNEEIRQFKFKMEHERVESGTGQFVMEHFSKYEIPGFIGAYPELHTNSVVFIAAPEAELAIRKALATRIIELSGIPVGVPMPLETQKEYLQKQRKEQLAELANLECELVGNEEEPKVVERYKLLLAESNKELEIIERKIQIVEKYIKRQNEEQP
jgi:hypothetical protein